MVAYRKERIENAILFFANEHFKETKQYLSKTALYKYLSFFEFRCLEKYGEMPLELQYRAMEQGPVPIEIYSDSNFLSLVTIEVSKTSGESIMYLVKPDGNFNADYFSENELIEMQNLIDTFAQHWVGADVMIDTSHQKIRAWKTTYSQKPKAMIDPIKEFSRNISTVPVDDLKWQEERFLWQRKMNELSARISARKKDTASFFTEEKEPCLIALSN